MTLLRKYIWVFVIIGIIFVSLVIGLIFLIINKCISTKGKHKVFHRQKRSDTYFFESNKYQERNLDAYSPAPSLPPRTQFVTEDALGFEEQADENNYEQMPDYEQSMEQQPDYVKVEEEIKLTSPSSFYNYSNTQKRPSVLLGENHKDLDSWENCFEECSDQQLDYVKMEEETNVLPLPPFNNSPNGKSGASLSESYENLAEENDYEGVDHQPDYETADNDTEMFPPPPLCNDPRISGRSLCQSYEYQAGENNYEESEDQQPDYVTVEDEEADEEADPAADDSSEDYDDIGSENEEDYDDVA